MTHKFLQEILVGVITIIMMRSKSDIVEGSKRDNKVVVSRMKGKSLYHTRKDGATRERDLPRNDG